MMIEKLTARSVAPPADSSAATIKGRRPKISAVSVNQKQNNGKQESQKLIQVSMHANPLERLCKLFLSWKILNSNKENDISESLLEEVYNLKHIPILFQSYQQYVDAFEPLIIEEMKAGILNNFKSGDIQVSTCQFSVMEKFEKETELTVLETDFKISDR